MSTDGLAQLRDDFYGINNDDDLRKFVAQYGFKSDGLDQHPSPQTLAVAECNMDGHVVRFVHRWFDPSGPFQNLPDINKLHLLIDGKSIAGTEFPD